jgi:hypothetical protein
MKFHTINLIHALVLMSASLWMYKSSVNPSVIHLIFFMVGVILLALNNGIKEGSAEQKKVAAIISFFVFLSMAMLLLTQNIFIEEGFSVYLILILCVSLIAEVIYFFQKN